METKKLYNPTIRKDREYENLLGPIRVKKGFTLQKLAEESGVSVSTISSLQNGMISPLFPKYRENHKAGEPRPYILKICKILNTSIGKLFSRDVCDYERFEFQKDREPLTKAQLQEVYCENDDVGKYEARVTLEEIVGMLKISGRNSSRNLGILMEYYYDDGTLESIGKKCNLSREEIRQILSKSIWQLRNIIKRLGLTEKDFY